MRTLYDVTFLVLLAVVYPIADHQLYQRYLRRLGASVPGARPALYRQTMLTLWGVSGLAILLWVTQRHPWSAVPLVGLVPWRLAIGAVLIGTLVYLLARQLGAVRRSAKARASVRRQVGHFVSLLPVTPHELRLFFGLSVTAGICEEWLYRGVLTALFAAWVGLPCAVLLANVAFGFAHSYQGRKGIVSTGLVGVVMSGIVIATGSLVVAMILHALVDAGNGLITYLATTVADDASGEVGVAALG
jgi:membrane protease YdiL (CAAX protease family)